MIGAKHGLLRPSGSQNHPGGFARSAAACRIMSWSNSPDGGALLSDLDDRWRGGLAVGDLFKALFILAKNKPALASWENAIRVYEISAKRAGSSGSRTELYQERSRFLSVAHLWGAWSIRKGNFGERLEVGYDGWADFQCFLTEAEILRDFGQNWRPSRAKSKPPLPVRTENLNPDIMVMKPA